MTVITVVNSYKWLLTAQFIMETKVLKTTAKQEWHASWFLKLALVQHTYWISTLHSSLEQHSKKFQRKHVQVCSRKQVWYLSRSLLAKNHKL